MSKPIYTDTGTEYPELLQPQGQYVSAAEDFYDGEEVAWPEVHELAWELQKADEPEVHEAWQAALLVELARRVAAGEITEAEAARATDPNTTVADMLADLRKATS